MTLIKFKGAWQMNLLMVMTAVALFFFNTFLCAIYSLCAIVSSILWVAKFNDAREHILKHDMSEQPS